jgi:hypothetical protein
MKGKTTAGFEFDIPDDSLKDWDVVRNLSALEGIANEDENDPTTLAHLINILSNIEIALFKDGGRAFEKHLRKENDGKLPTDKVLVELIEVLKSCKAKNS